MKTLLDVCKFLKAAGTYYLATVDCDKPRVRPFGTAHIYNGKLYIQTGKKKAVSHQIAANPNVEICAMVFYFKNATATLSSFTKPQETLNF